MINQHDLVRGAHHCVRCNRYKSEGLLLCWPCHHAEKRAHNGMYSKKTEAAIAALDRHLEIKLAILAAVP